MSLSAQAQMETTLPFMTDIFQSTYANPTIIPEHKVSIGLPLNVSVQAINRGLRFDEFVKFKNDTTTSLNINKLYDGMLDRNMLYMGQNLDLFHVRVKIQNAFYWLAVREHLTNSFFYSKDIMALVMEGTMPYIGKRMDFSDIMLKSQLYMEYTLGMSMMLDKLTIGARVSLLKGITNVDFAPDVLELQIEDKTWANTARADGQFKTSGVPKDKAGNIGFDNIDLNWIKENVIGVKNNGFALSAGVSYSFDDRLKASFSFYDLGYIDWKQNLESYRLKGEFKLSGVDVLANFLDGKGLSFDSLMMGFKDAFKFDTIQGDPYRTWLNPKFNVSVSYKLASRTVVAALVNATYNTELQPSLTLGISQGLGRFFNLTANASFAHQTIKNLGVGVVIKPGPLQIFFAFDNYYPLLGNTQLLSFTNTSVRVGLNLVFGRVSQPDGMPLW